MQSFQVKSLNEIEPKYIQFLKRTKFYIKTKKYIFVHAGLNFSKTNLFEDKDAMLWLRDFPSNQPLLEGQILIHGHTPKSFDSILSQNGNCFNIDCGCVFKEHSHFGKLVAINLTERKFIFINNCEQHSFLHNFNLLVISIFLIPASVFYGNMVVSQSFHLSVIYLAYIS